MVTDFEQRQTYFPGRISRIILISMQEVLGLNGLHAVLNTARLGYLIDNDPPANFEPGLSFAEAGQLFEAVEGIYGVSAGRRLAYQAGRASFKHWVEGFGGALGLADFVLRILPVATRVRIGLEIVAEILNRYAGQLATLGESRSSFFLVSEAGGFCWGRQTEAPSCAFVSGMLEEVLFWVSHGRRFVVEETTCIASGDPVCTFCVAKLAEG